MDREREIYDLTHRVLDRLEELGVEVDEPVAHMARSISESLMHISWVIGWVSEDDES